MKKKLNCILLVDDDEPTNFLNKMVIKKVDCAEKVVVATSGLAAIEYLKSMENGEHPRPDLLFLDINMPAMNGWEFLAAYKQLEKQQQSQVVIVMLSTSLNPEDELRAQSIDEINDFRNKPLTVEILEEILIEYFPERQ